MIVNVLSIFFGYLLGSILPAYYLGRLKGIDIRQEGANYAGTINVYHVVGVKSAIVTGIVDLSKGVIAIQLAQNLGADFSAAQISGLAAIAGHVLPFYLDFQGGQGVACATGILLYYLGHYLSLAGLELHTLSFLALIVFIFAYVARHGEVVSLIILPLLAFAVLSHSQHDPLDIYLVMICLYIMGVGVHNIITRKLLVITSASFHRHFWRVILRPFALIFVVCYLLTGKQNALLLLGIVTLVFFLLDILHLKTRDRQGRWWRKIQRLFKQSENHRLSSLSLFLLSSFALLLIFNSTIAITSMIFLIFGDLFGKIFGLAYGRHPWFHKTVEGSLSYLGGALMSVYVLSTIFPWSPSILLSGAIAATITESLPIGVDDNLTVAIASATTMLVAQTVGL